MKFTAWLLRSIVLFAATYTIVTVLHELTHALTAYALHIPSRVFHFAANIDRTQGSINQRAVIAFAGPLLAFVVGVVSWVAYLRTPSSRLGLLFLYLVMFGAGTFFGNLISTAFVGDFSRVALALQLPMALRYSLSVLGVLLLCGLSFLIGIELRRWTPASVSATKAVIGIVALPVLLGTAITLLISLPLPSVFIFSRISESLFWIPAAVGTLISRKQPSTNRRALELGWPDFALLLVVTLVVRLMVHGIAFTP